MVHMPGCPACGIEDGDTRGERPVLQAAAPLVDVQGWQGDQVFDVSETVTTKVLDPIASGVAAGYNWFKFRQKHTYAHYQ